MGEHLKPCLQIPHSTHHNIPSCPRMQPSGRPSGTSPRSPKIPVLSYYQGQCIYILLASVVGY